MTKYRLKLVPDAEPNADGRYIEVQTYRFMAEQRWYYVTEFFAPYVRYGEHLVQWETLPPDNPALLARVREFINKALRRG